MATVTSSGGFKPSTKDTPLDIRTRVNTYEEIENIPNPYIGMEIIVLADETNKGRRTKYEVRGLKPNEIGIEDSLIDMDTIKRVESYEVNLEELVNLSKEDIDDFFLNTITDVEDVPYTIQLLSFPKIEPLEIGEYILRVGNEEIVYNNTIPNNKEALFSGVDVVVRLYTDLDENNTPSENYSSFYFEKGISTETSTDLYLYKSNTLYINEDAIPKKYISEDKTQKLINKSFNELREIINNIEIGSGDGGDATISVKEFDSIDKGSMSTHIEFSEIPATSKCYLIRGTIGSGVTNGGVAFNGDLVYITKDNNKLNIYTLDGKIYTYSGGTNGTNYNSFSFDECANKSITNAIQTTLAEIQNCLPLLTISESNEELDTLPDGDKVYILNGLNINNDVVHISKSGNNVTITTINGVISKYTKSGTSWSSYSTDETATKTYVDDAIANAQLGSEGDSGGGLTVEQSNQLVTAYEHSQSAHVQSSDIPTKVSDLENDSGFITSVPDEYITETELNAKGYLTSHQDISGLQPKTDDSLTTTDKTVIGAINELKTNMSNINTGSENSFSGSYNDLTDKPTIPTKTSQLNNDSGFIDNTCIIIVNKGDNITEVNIDNDIPSGSSTILLTGRIVSDLYDKQLVTVNKSSTAMTVWDTKGSKVVFNKSNGSWARSSSATHVYNNDASAIYQKINDNTLTTTAKTVVGAINELKTTVDNINTNGGEINETTPNNIYTFNDAYTQWCKGEKFPIAFYGDSTIDGNSTTGYVANTLGADSTSTNTFCNVLQALLREECNSTTLRIYNAGFSGRTMSWAVTNFDAEFGEGTAYSDVKMIGIGFGINDRLSPSDMATYRNDIKTNTETLINKCYEKGIQPFLLTTQATAECGVQSDHISSFPLRDSFSINVCANEVKRELAKKYNIPLIDINEYTELFLEYSKNAVNEITADRLHFTDIGHKYEADVIFAHIVPRTIFIEHKDDKLITYTNQNLRNAIPEDKISYGGLLKTYAQYTQTSATDVELMDCYVFIKDRPAKLSAIKTGLVNLTHVKIDGVDNDSPLDVTNLGEIDLGLHHLEAYSGANTSVDFCGFAINSDIQGEVLANGLNYQGTMAFFSTDASVMPTVICTNHDKVNHTTLLSGKTITKVVLPISTAGKITIAKCDISTYGTGVMPTLIGATQYDVVVGNNTIEVNIQLGEHESLVLTNTSDTAIPYFAMCTNAARLPNYYKYTHIYTPPQFKDSSEIAGVVFCCAIYGK